MLDRLPSDLQLQVYRHLNMDAIFQLHLVSHAVSNWSVLMQARAQCIETLTLNLYACDSLTDVWRWLRRFSETGFRPHVSDQRMLTINPHMVFWHIKSLPAMDRYRLIMAMLCEQHPAAQSNGTHVTDATDATGIDQSMVQTALDQAFVQFSVWSQFAFADCYMPATFAYCHICEHRIPEESVATNRTDGRSVCYYCVYMAQH